MTVVKMGFLFTGRMGTGLIVVRLPGGGWSAPSAIGTLGMGVGGQIGAEITDFVIVLNTDAAVKAFSMGGNVTLGGNLSVAAGPFGRNAEASTAVAHVAPFYSYSKTKGLFVGISIEGAVIVERKDANRQYYGETFSPSKILSGEVQAKPSCTVLYDALDKEAHQNSHQPERYLSESNHNNTHLPSPSSMHDDLSLPRYQTLNLPTSSSFEKKKPTPPPIPSRLGTARALYDFEGERPSDLSFKQGDIITITRQTGSVDDSWWAGSLHGLQGDVTLTTKI